MPLTEKSLTETPFARKLISLGWTEKTPDELERESMEEPLLINNLKQAIERINGRIGQEEIKKVLNEIRLRSSGQEDGKKLLNNLKNGISVVFEKEKVAKRIYLFDYEHQENNEFILVRQMTFKKSQIIRPDILLYINGIPLVNIECKNPASISATWYDAYKEIQRYKLTIPELYKYVQIGIAIDQKAFYFPIVGWAENEKTSEWKSERRGGIEGTLDMLKPQALLNILKNYLFIRAQAGATGKVIARHMQYQASEKIVNRVFDNLKGKEKLKKGLTWHWQGSGKTLTMLFSAIKLFNSKELENPTIFFIVDRDELEQQLFEEFAGVDVPTPEIVPSIEGLKKLLLFDGGRGKRGLFIALVHKFRVEQLAYLQKELEEISKTAPTVLTRKNIIVFVDEGHRTQYGTLASQMRTTLANAFFFGFTGTPISKSGRDTFMEFSNPPKENYLDKYSMRESIEDGYTVKFSYQPRLEKHVHLKKELLDAFLEYDEEELPEEIREKVKEKVKKRLNEINVFLSDPKRIKEISKDIAAHFKESLDGKFKAMVVAANRESCVRYKEELDKLLPKEYSEVVITYNLDDKEPLNSYRKGVVSRFGDLGFDEINRRIKENFKNKEFPKIIIVTEMLLAGFDAPQLQTMYLDKPLKEHRLLQAIARTNRPYKELKEAGLILDYVGILENLKRAFENYAEGEDISTTLNRIDTLADDFVQTLEETKKSLSDALKEKNEAKMLIKALEGISSDIETANAFIENYKRLRRIFELLGPDKVKAQYYPDFHLLSKIYFAYLKNIRNIGEEEAYLEKYFARTLKHIYKSIEFGQIRTDLPHSSFDLDYLRKVEEKANSKEEKAANILFALNRLVNVEREKNPVYESVFDKVQKLVEKWKQKTEDYESLYREGAKIREQIEELNKRKEGLCLSNNEYAILLSLENEFGEKKELADDAKELSKLLTPFLFDGWLIQHTARRNVESTVRKFVRRYVQKYGKGFSELDKVCEKIFENVKTYAI
ncbi:hypothetical protein AUJ17_00925 [Candidatus Micrarchaeota archaeon CG1_02_47_40]|nr:MAG: hypothetical protein AUJ17_00925 [Candidatus Micrarchaeota archaeon CG1_02_47_40]